MKKVIWLGKSRDFIRKFPSQAQDIAGKELRSVQLGISPSDWRPMPVIGPGTIEIRIHNPNEYRVIYVAKFSEAIYMLHCFVKKTNQTSLKDIQIARRAYDSLQKLQ